MVIQSNMPVKGIHDAWPETQAAFKKYGINCSSTESVAMAAGNANVQELLTELNETVRSSEETCTAGG